MALSRPELERLYQELEVPLYNYALRWVWNPSLAEEIVHDAFVRLWQKRGSISMETIKGLVYKIAHNLCLNELRKKRLRESLPLLDVFFVSHDTQPDFIKQNDLENLRAALDLLPQELREVLLMTEYSDLSYDEVARALDIPPGTVASRKSRAIQQLRATLKGKIDV